MTLADSFGKSMRMKFSVHTGGQTQPTRINQPETLLLVTHEWHFVSVREHRRPRVETVGSGGVGGYAVKHKFGHVDDRHVRQHFGHRIEAELR